jgi:hypothetical protein
LITVGEDSAGGPQASLPPGATAVAGDEPVPVAAGPDGDGGAIGVRVSDRDVLLEVLLAVGFGVPGAAAGVGDPARVAAAWVAGVAAAAAVVDKGVAPSVVPAAVGPAVGGMFCGVGDPRRRRASSPDSAGADGDPAPRRPGAGAADDGAHRYGDAGTSRLWSTRAKPPS